jgi:site-specific recombinase XerD
MSQRKGDRVETGIWRMLGGKGYVGEVNYSDPKTGRRVREQRSFHRLDLVREWRQARKVDAVRKELRRKKDQPVGIEFTHFANEYLRSWSKIHKRESSYVRDQTSIKRLSLQFGGRLLAELKRRDIEQYLAMRKSEGRTTATCNRELCCLKNMLRKAVDWEYLEANPAGSIKQQRETPPQFEILTEAEIGSMLNCSAGHLRVLLTVAVHTGMRRGELFKLDWSDVKFDDSGRGQIRIRDSKNHDTRHIPMNTVVVSALKSHPRRVSKGILCPLVFSGDAGNAVTTVTKGYKGALKRAGIYRHVRFHDLRHTFASHLVMKGVDLRTVASLLGHRDIKMTMRYAHLAPEHLQAAVDVLVPNSQGDLIQNFCMVR